MNFNEEGLRNFKDFLSTYNKLSEACFNRCIINLNHRKLSSEESLCADLCVQKQMNCNNRAVQTFMVDSLKSPKSEWQTQRLRPTKRLKNWKSRELTLMRWHLSNWQRQPCKSAHARREVDRQESACERTVEPGFVSAGVDTRESTAFEACSHRIQVDLQCVIFLKRDDYFLCHTAQNLFCKISH